MEQFQKGQDEESHGHSHGVAVCIDAVDESENDDERLHRAEKEHGNDGGRGKYLRRASGRAFHHVAVRAFRAEGENGQAVRDQVDPQKLRGREKIESIQHERYGENT